MDRKNQYPSRLDAFFRLAGLSAGRVTLAASASILVALQGCETTTKVEGDITQAIANYQSGTLTANLNAAPSSVLAAAEQTLRDRGYSIEDNAATKEQGAIVARPPNYNLLKTMKVAVGPDSDGGSKVAITTNPWDEGLARITLSGIMKRLGM